MQENSDLSLIVYKQRVYNIKAWLPKHPGGDLVITHVLGKDATNQILAFHLNTRQIERIMDKYLYATLSVDEAIGLVDSTVQMQQQEDNDHLVKSFDALKDTVSRLGLMNTTLNFYYMKGLQYLIQFIVSLFICWYATPYYNSIIGGISIGMVMKLCYNISML